MANLDLNNQEQVLHYLGGLEQQIVALQGQVQPRGAGLKPREFENVKGRYGEDWPTWLFSFEKVAEGNRWDDRTRKNALSSCMKGRAAELVMDIPTDTNAAGDPLTFEDVKLLYSARFVSPADSQLARSNFGSARQGEKEDELSWHARCRALFRRAYPEKPHEVDMDLILKFTCGLRNRTLAHYVQDGNPHTYGDALVRCQNKRATCELIDGHKYTGEPMEIGALKDVDNLGDHLEKSLNIAAVNQPRGNRPPRGNSNRTDRNQERKREEKKKRRGKCHWCMVEGHFQSQCPKYVFCRLQFLSSEGHEIPEEDLRRAKTEIGALEAGNYEPSDTPYHSEDLLTNEGKEQESHQEEEDF